jgi:hypothetical protein
MINFLIWIIVGAVIGWIASIITLNSCKIVDVANRPASPATDAQDKQPAKERKAKVAVAGAR